MVSTLTQLALWVSLLVAARRRSRSSPGAGSASSAPALSILALVAALRGPDGGRGHRARPRHVRAPGRANDRERSDRHRRRSCASRERYTGDLIAAARLVEISGTVTGDVLAFAEEIDVTGTVGGNVRTGSRSLDIEGLVERNVTAAGEILRVGPGAQVRGSFTAAGREAILAAPSNAISSSPRKRTASTPMSEARRSWWAMSSPSATARSRKERSSSMEGASPRWRPARSSQSPVAFERIEEDDEDDPRLSWLTHFLLLLGRGVRPRRGVRPSGARRRGGGHRRSPAAAREEFLRRSSGRRSGRRASLWLDDHARRPSPGLRDALLLVPRPLPGAGLRRALHREARFWEEPTDRSQLLVRLAVGLLAIHIAKSIPYLGHVVTVAVALWGFGALVLFFLDGLTGARLPSRPHRFLPRSPRDPEHPGVLHGAHRERGEGERGEASLELATAALLIEVSRADFDVSEEERGAIEEGVRKSFGLTEEETREIVALAEEEVLAGGLALRVHPARGPELHAGAETAHRRASMGSRPHRRAHRGRARST